MTLLIIETQSNKMFDLIDEYKQTMRQFERNVAIVINVDAHLAAE